MFSFQFANFFVFVFFCPVLVTKRAALEHWKFPRQQRKRQRGQQTNNAVFTESRPGPSNLGTVFSQIILCKQLAPDFNAEELRSIRKDSEDIQRLVDDLSEFMPMEESYGTNVSFIDRLFFLLEYIAHELDYTLLIGNATLGNRCIYMYGVSK